MCPRRTFAHASSFKAPAGHVRSPPRVMIPPTCLALHCAFLPLPIQAISALEDELGGLEEGVLGRRRSVRSRYAKPPLRFATDSAIHFDWTQLLTKQSMRHLHPPPPLFSSPASQIFLFLSIRRTPVSPPQSSPPGSGGHIPKGLQEDAEDRRPARATPKFNAPRLRTANRGEERHRNLQVCMQQQAPGPSMVA